MKGLLVRVGIDSTAGHWNAPVNLDTYEFAYVTITETEPLRHGLARLFDEFRATVSRFKVEMPRYLEGAPTHLDPDFSTLTYGDQGERAKQVQRLTSGDLLAFFAGLRDPGANKLLYGLIGLYVVDEIVSAKTIARNRWPENAHTRRIPGPTDIVVRARPKISGRLERCIPIGEYRAGAYRVRKDLVSAWGGLTVYDGYIQRSARLPAFRETARFYRWFLKHRRSLVQRNN